MTQESEANVTLRSGSPFCGAVYELIDPRDGRCRYVGQTFFPRERSRQHKAKRPVHQQNSDLLRWKQELSDLGLSPQFRIIEDAIPAVEINEKESYWCRSRSDEGFDLLNRPVAHITKGDLFGSLQRADLAMAAGEMIEALLAMLMRVNGKLPKRHKALKHLEKSLDELRKVKWALED